MMNTIKDYNSCSTSPMNYIEIAYLIHLLNFNYI